MSLTVLYLLLPRVLIKDSLFTRCSLIFHSQRTASDMQNGNGYTNLAPVFAQIREKTIFSSYLRLDNISFIYGDRSY